MQVVRALILLHEPILGAEEEYSSVLRPPGAGEMAGHLRIHSTPRMQLPGQKSILGSGQRAAGSSLVLSARKCVCVSVYGVMCGHVYCC